MQIELYDTGRLEREFVAQPEVLAKLRELREVNEWRESPDHDMRVVPGDRKDLLALPGCALDGQVDSPWYIDLGVDSDDGACYVGTTMFQHLANLVGYCDVAELKTAYQRIEELEKEVARLTKLTGRLRVVRAELDDMEREPVSGPPAESGRRSKAPSGTAA